MDLEKRSVAAPKTAICFACNQSFDGNPIALQFSSTLLAPSAEAELQGLYFHPHHLLHYAKRREWHVLVEYITKNGPTNF
jgi:hypothetical protein